MLHRSLDNLSLSNTWVTVGSFDGVHRGHQAIIRDMVRTANDAGNQTAAVTFHPHPSVVLRGISGRFYLSDPEERAALLADLGVDHVVIQPFTESLAQESASDFSLSLVNCLGMRHLWVGADFRMGRRREGDTALLAIIGKKLGFQVHIQPQVDAEGMVVSSSRIRHLLTLGQVHEAASLLGRPYRLHGEVVHGHGRGKKIGFPTANIQLWEQKMLPANGVYATRAYVNGRCFFSVTNIGFRPTFEQPGQVSVETHLLEFDEDIYGQVLTIDFFFFMRSEQRFQLLAGLIDQLHCDVKQARKVLADA